MKKEKAYRSYITLDIGGTNWRMALFEEGAIKTFNKGSWRSDLTPEVGLKKLREIIIPFIDERTKVGIAFPGLIEGAGIIHVPPNLPKWDKYNLKKELEKRVETSVCVANDANMYALGEWRYGVAQGCSDVIVITLGTGVGGGIISGGRLILGRHAFAGEIGHIFIDGDRSKRCGCGNYGCLEAFVGATFFTKDVQKTYGEKGLTPPKDLEEMANFASEGDSLALRLWKAYGRFLGRGLAAVSNLLDPECIVIGGGVSKAWDYFFPALLESLKKNVIGEQDRNINILRSGLGDKAALFGMYEFLKMGCYEYEKKNGY